MKKTIACILLLFSVGDLALFAADAIRVEAPRGFEVYKGNKRIEISEVLTMAGYDEAITEAQRKADNANRAMDITGYTLLGLGLTALVSGIIGVAGVLAKGHGVNATGGAFMITAFSGIGASLLSIPFLAIHINDKISVSAVVGIASSLNDAR